MKKTTFMVIRQTVIYLVVILFFNFCKLGSPNYSVVVTIGEGITGTPEAGTYLYEEFTHIDYDYSPQEGAVQPAVYVNGNKRTYSTGTLTLYCDIEISVEQTDIRGTWKMKIQKPDLSVDEWEITFSGDNLQIGTFSDDRGHEGNWSVIVNDLTITFSDWKDYKFTGTISSMTGNWAGDGQTGSWEAVKI